MSESLDPIRAVLEQGANDPDPLLARKSRRALQAIEEWEAALKPTPRQAELMAFVRRERPDSGLSDAQLLNMIRQAEAQFDRGAAR